MNRPSFFRRLLSVTFMLLLLAGCNNSEPDVVALPTRTPRPTFTPSPLPPAPQPVAAAGADTATPVPDTAAPVSDQPATDSPIAASQAAKAVITIALANVRTGPGTEYGLASTLERGAEFEIVGKNSAGDWWQLCCVSGQNVWIADFLVDTSGPVDTVAVSPDIPAPPIAAPLPVVPTAAPAPAPAPAQPTAIPAPVFTVRKDENVPPRPNSNPIISFFGMLCKEVCPHGGAAGGYKLIVDGPQGRSEGTFDGFFSDGDPGLSSQFFYNVKIEIAGAPAGGYRAFVADAGGNQISEAWDYVVSGELRTFLPRWVAP